MAEPNQPQEHADEPVRIEVALGYALRTFEIRLQEIERLRTRSLVSLGLMSGAAALLAIDGMPERLMGVFGIPAAFFIFSIVLAIPPLMSLTIVYPMKLRLLNEYTREYTATAIRKALLRDTAESDEAAQRLCEAISMYSDASIRTSLVGVSALVAAAMSPATQVHFYVWLGVAVGVAIVGIAGVLRGPLKISGGVETKKGDSQDDA